MSMQSTGQGGRQSSQPMHQSAITVCMSPRAPAIASTGHAAMQSVQPMQRPSSMSATASRFIAGGKGASYRAPGTGASLARFSPGFRF